MKIAVVGCPGSGKSTVAKRLHKLLNLPLYHLDQHFWLPGWQRPDREEFAKIHHRLCDNDQWIIEGMATRLLEYRAQKADVIIFLDVPVWRCLYRIYKRALAGYGTLRDSSAPGCPERLPTGEFLAYILNFKAQYRPHIEAVLEHYAQKKKIYIVKNSTDVEALIKNLERGIHQN